jgi:hypothetical protein
MLRALTIACGMSLILVSVGIVFATCNAGKLQALYGQLAATALFTLGLGLIANGV